jgi:hypothetical protein
VHVFRNRKADFEDNALAFVLDFGTLLCVIKMWLANWSCSIFNVTDPGFDGGGILISGDLSRVV